MTRQQQYLIAAMTNVGAVKQVHDEELDKAYGGLCHALPILVRNDGLAQAVAWIEEKAQGHNEQNASALKRAYHLQRQHITSMLGVTANDPNGSALVQAVHSATNLEYMRYTMLMLDAWVYYKRFASSVLGVDSPQESGDTEEATL